MKTQEQFHFIGIGGIGMSALARILLEKKIAVSGSDLKLTSTTESLQRLGANICPKQGPENVQTQHTVVYSSAVKGDNPEFQAAKDLNCRVMHRSELLHHLMAGQKCLGVVGTHGKTTTTSLLASILKHAKMDPSYAIGGILTEQDSNGAFGQGEYFVAELDESDGSFQRFHPYGAIITNVAAEHLDHYGDIMTLEGAFKEFIGTVAETKHLFYCGDDPFLKANGKGRSYGMDPDNDVQILSIAYRGWKTYFDLSIDGKCYEDISLSLPGDHNVLNAAACFALALSLDIEEDLIRAAIGDFKGVSRRCEKIGERNHILTIDDYAHHPTEIKTTLKAIRKSIGDRRLIVAFQAHRYSRTRDCLGKFKGVFSEADQVIIPEIYAAGESPIPGISHKEILAEIQGDASSSETHIPKNKLLAYLRKKLKPHDVLVTMGAGDITEIGRQLYKEKELFPQEKLKIAVLMGGSPTEHAISLVSARTMIGALKNGPYEIEEFLINADLTWGEASSEGALLSSDTIIRLSKCDLAIPALHGPFGEDGTIQGFLETLGLPYLGPNQTAASIAMDKVSTKRLMQAVGIKVAKYLAFTKAEWFSDLKSHLRKISAELHYPLYVKPCHLGSSVGVCKVDNEEGLIEAAKKAFDLDHDLLIEEEIKGREMEFAVMGNDDVRVAGPGELLTNGETYSYEKKYGKDSAQTTPDPLMNLDLKIEGKRLAELAYRTARCTGFSRVDFFLDKDNHYWLNEINPIPGFTAISLFPSLWYNEGIALPDLMGLLICYAMGNHHNRLRMRR